MFAIYAKKNGKRKTIYNDSWLTVGEYVSGVVVEDPVLTLEDNQPGTFKVTIPPENQGYDFIGRYTTELIVCRLKKNTTGIAITEEEIFRGRVIDEEEDFLHNRILTAQGELSYLSDTRQPTKKYNRGGKPEDYFKALLKIHNSKAESNRQFKMGTCQFQTWSQETLDAIAAADKDDDAKYRTTSYEDTLTCISNAFADLKNPHLRIRHATENGRDVRYLDILTDGRDGGTWGAASTEIAGQDVVLGSNLLDYTKNYDLSDICSVIIPLGAHLEGDAGHLGDVMDISLDFGKTLNEEGSPIDLINEDGSIDEGFVITKVDISKLSPRPEKVFYTGRNWNGYCHYSFVNSSGEVIDSKQSKSGSGPTYTDLIEEVVTVPTDAKYMYAATEQTVPLRLNKYLTDGEAEEYVTVADVEDINPSKKRDKKKGTVFVKNADLLNTYGWIEKVIEFPNIKTPQILYDRAINYLQNDVYENMVLEVKAIDMSNFDSAITPYSIGKCVRVYEPTNIAFKEGLTGNITPKSRLFPISKMEIHLDAPEDSVITLGYQTKLSISGVTTASSAKINQTINDVEASTMNGFKEYLANAKSYAAELIKTGMNGYVTLVRDPNNPDVISMITVGDNPDYKVADNLWVWNQNGFCHASSANGKKAWENLDTTMNVAITMDGAINADRILVGKMTADHIEGGRLKIGKTNGYEGVVDSFLEVYSLVKVSSDPDVYEPGIVCRIDERGLSYWGHDYEAGVYRSVSIDNGSVKGYYRPSPGAGSGSTNCGTIDLSKNNKHVAVTSRIEDLLLQSTRDIHLQVWDGQRFVTQVVIDRNGVHPHNASSGSITGAFKAKDSSGNDVNVHFRNGIIYQID